MILAFAGKRPRLAPEVFIAPGAHLIGEVHLAEGVSVWFNAVLRADHEPIRVGRYTNIQDNCTIHIDPGSPTVIGEYVTIGHGAIVHAATVEDCVLIGMHATVLSRAVIGRNSIIGAGALVTEGAVIPEGSLVLGVPGRVVRALRPEEIAGLREHARRYYELACLYRGATPVPAEPA
jgi:carbonic anhydrase/acetyltransferase-like protein (isoleucine patch superfamily)